MADSCLEYEPLARESFDASYTMQTKFVGTCGHSDIFCDSSSSGQTSYPLGATTTTADHH